MMQQLPSVRVEHEYFALAGGLDLVTPPLVRSTGSLQDCQNYECDINGGYKRVGGYERFDGHPSPSAQFYYTLPATISGGWAIGDTLTGVTSGATAIVIGAESNTALYLCKVTGTFQAAEDLQISAATIAVAGGAAYQGGASTLATDLAMYAATANQYRADISVVPGSGPVRGVWVLNDDIYAFRDNAGGTACVMHKATSGGWTTVTTPTLATGGRYEFINANFGGASGTTKMYGCDGANKAFQFDGTTYTEITTGMSVDTPTFLFAHKNHLFLAFDGSLQHSPIGNPTGVWTPVYGAGELAMGDTITGIIGQPGDNTGGALAIATRSKTWILYGTSSANWQLVAYSNETGCLPYTMQSIGTTYMLDDQGVIGIGTSPNFGNFEHATISHIVRPWVNENRPRVIASSISRDRNQYRLFTSAGRYLYATLKGREVVGFATGVFTNGVRCICSAEISDGSEAIYFGSDNGYVYQMDKSTSFDGERIEAYIKPSFNHSKSPRYNKRYRKGVLEIISDNPVGFFVMWELGYGKAGIDQNNAISLTTGNAAGNWDTGTWDAGFWDGKQLVPAEFSMKGTGENVAMTIYSSSDLYLPHTIAGVILQYSLRKGLR